MNKYSIKTAENHPFVTQDGRRWASAKGAAMTVLTQETPAAADALCPVVNERTKAELGFEDCAALWRGSGEDTALTQWFCGLKTVRGRMFGGAR